MRTLLDASAISDRSCMVAVSPFLGISTSLNNAIARGGRRERRVDIRQYISVFSPFRARLFDYMSSLAIVAGCLQKYIHFLGPRTLTIFTTMPDRKLLRAVHRWTLVPRVDTLGVGRRRLWMTGRSAFPYPKSSSTCSRVISAISWTRYSAQNADYIGGDLV